MQAIRLAERFIAITDYDKLSVIHWNKQPALVVECYDLLVRSSGSFQVVRDGSWKGGTNIQALQTNWTRIKGREEGGAQFVASCVPANRQR